jgi:hypothetical protein
MSPPYPGLSLAPSSLAARVPLAPHRREPLVARLDRAFAAMPGRQRLLAIPSRRLTAPIAPARGRAARASVHDAASTPTPFYAGVDPLDVITNAPRWHALVMPQLQRFVRDVQLSWPTQNGFLYPVYPGPKGADRTWAKIAGECGGDPSLLTDIIRMAIVFERAEGIDRFMNTQLPQLPVLSLTNRFTRPQRNGLRFVKVIVGWPTGPDRHLPVEIQLHLHDLWVIASGPLDRKWYEYKRTHPAAADWIDRRQQAHFCPIVRASGLLVAGDPCDPAGAG